MRFLLNHSYFRSKYTCLETLERNKRSFEANDLPFSDEIMLSKEQIIFPKQTINFLVNIFRRTSHISRNQSFAKIRLHSNQRFSLVFIVRLWQAYNSSMCTVDPEKEVRSKRRFGTQQIEHYIFQTKVIFFEMAHTTSSPLFDREHTSP